LRVELLLIELKFKNDETINFESKQKREKPYGADVPTNALARLST
jgi:hypothetical protein